LSNAIYSHEFLIDPNVLKPYISLQILKLLYKINPFNNLIACSLKKVPFTTL